MALSRIRRQPRRYTVPALVFVILAFAALVFGRANEPAQATSGGSPYVVPLVVDTNPDPNIVETTIVADEATVDIGGGVMAHALTFNGTIPGPEFRLNVGDTRDRPLREPPRPRRPGSTGTASSSPTRATARRSPRTRSRRAGRSSTSSRSRGPGSTGTTRTTTRRRTRSSRACTGRSSSPIRTRPRCIADGDAPAAPRRRRRSSSATSRSARRRAATTPRPTTRRCRGSGGGPLPAQAGRRRPTTLCETSPIDEDGNSAAAPFAAGDIPNIQTAGTAGRSNEGQTVLTNGMNVGGRAGTPAAPGALAAGAQTLDVQAGQGLRLQIGNTATIRFFRLRLTDSAGDADRRSSASAARAACSTTPCVEGGIVRRLRLELLHRRDPARPGRSGRRRRRDPADRDRRAHALDAGLRRAPASGFANIPTVPVAHFNVTGTAASPYTIAAGTPLRSRHGRPAVEALGPRDRRRCSTRPRSPRRSPGLAEPGHPADEQPAASLGINGVHRHARLRRRLHRRRRTRPRPATRSSATRSS